MTEGTAPALSLPRLIAVDNLNGILSDARKRTKDSHRIQMQALGMKPEEMAEDDMGISVAGDTNIHIAATPEKAAVVETKPESSTAMKLIGAVAAGMGVTGLPIIGFILASLLNRPATETVPAPVTQSPANSEYDVFFYDKDGKPIDVRPLSERPATP